MRTYASSLARSGVIRLFSLAIILSLVPLASVKSQETYFTANIGPWIGKTAFKVSESGLKGSHPVNYWGMDLLVKGEDLYIRANLNGIFTTLIGKSPDDVMKAGNDAVMAMGTDVSFFDLAWGTNHKGPFSLAFHFDYGWHGPMIPDAGMYPASSSSMYFDLGMEGCMYLPIGELGRTITILNVDPLLFSSSEEKALDGWAMGIESQIQFSAFRYIGLGITPRYEYRRYNLPINSVESRVRTSTFSTQFHVFVGF